MNIEVPDVVINHHGNVKALIRFASSDIWFPAFKGVSDLTKMQSAPSFDKVFWLKGYFSASFSRISSVIFSGFGFFSGFCFFGFLSCSNG